MEHGIRVGRKQATFYLCKKHRDEVLDLFTLEVKEEIFGEIKRHNIKRY